MRNQGNQHSKNFITLVDRNEINKLSNFINKHKNHHDFSEDLLEGLVFTASEDMLEMAQFLVKKGANPRKSTQAGGIDALGKSLSKGSDRVTRYFLSLSELRYDCCKRFENPFETLDTSKLISARDLLINFCLRKFKPNDTICLSKEEKIRMLFFARYGIESEVHNMSIPFNSADLMQMSDEDKECLSNGVKAIMQFQSDIDDIEGMSSARQKNRGIEDHYKTFCLAFKIDVRTLEDEVLMMEQIARRDFDNYRMQQVGLNLLEVLGSVQTYTDAIESLASVYNPLGLESSSRMPNHKFISSRIDELREEKKIWVNNFKDLNVKFFYANLRFGMFSNLVACFNFLALDEYSLSYDMASTVLSVGRGSKYEPSLNSIAQYILYRVNQQEQLRAIIDLPTNPEIILGDRPFKKWAEAIQEKIKGNLLQLNFT